MSAARQEEIVRRLTEFGRVRVGELASAFDVSHETIRRDLTELEARGVVRRTHGGAVPFAANREQPVADRARIRAREKSQIGLLAAQLVEDGMSIFIDTGSTPSACARYLLGRVNLTVTTNSLDIAKELAPSTGIRVKLVPGNLRRKDHALIGPETLAHLQRCAFELALAGIGGCDRDIGWMDYESDESEIRKVIAPRVDRLTILADDSKFGRRASVQTFPLDQSLVVITNRKPPEAFAKVFADNDINVIAP